MPASWKQYGVDANGDKKKDPYNPVDAIFAAARYLKAAGADKDLARAIFAYNHADWYVDSVLMRARLIGGLPMDLVGSLTGLTQGRFPIAARARYADDVDARAATRRIAKGSNAAVPIEADEQRRDINIYAQPGSPVVAVQDGTVVRRGHSKTARQLRRPARRLRQHVPLRGARSRWPSATRSCASARPQAPVCTPHPPRDPAPKQAASARARSGKHVKKVPLLQARRAPPGQGARCSPQPERPAAKAAGGRAAARAGAATRPTSSCSASRADAGRDEGAAQGARASSAARCSASSGRTSEREAPHIVFAIRPAGRGAPQDRPQADPRRLEAARVLGDLPRAQAQPVLRRRRARPRRSARSC